MFGDSKCYITKCRAKAPTSSVYRLSLLVNWSGSILELVTDFRCGRPVSGSNTFITTDVRATGQQSVSAFTQVFCTTGIVVAALKHRGTVWREALNRFMNKIFNVDEDTLSKTNCLPAALLLGQLSHLVLLHIEGRREWYSRVRRLTDIGVDGVQTNILS